MLASVEGSKYSSTTNGILISSALQIRFVDFIVDIGTHIDQFFSHFGPMFWVFPALVENRKYQRRELRRVFIFVFVI